MGFAFAAGLAKPAPAALVVLPAAFSQKKRILKQEEMGFLPAALRGRAAEAAEREIFAAQIAPSALPAASALPAQALLAELEIAARAAVLGVAIAGPVLALERAALAGLRKIAVWFVSWILLAAR